MRREKKNLRHIRIDKILAITCLLISISSKGLQIVKRDQKHTSIIRSICWASPGRRKASRNIRRAVRMETPLKLKVLTYSLSTSMLKSLFLPIYWPIVGLSRPGVKRRIWAISLAVAGLGMTPTQWWGRKGTYQLLGGSEYPILDLYWRCLRLWRGSSSWVSSATRPSPIRDVYECRWWEDLSHQRRGRERTGNSSGMLKFIASVVDVLDASVDDTKGETCNDSTGENVILDGLIQVKNKGKNKKKLMWIKI